MLEGLIKLNYAASRKAASNIYIYIYRAEYGKGRHMNPYKQYIDMADGAR